MERDPSIRKRRAERHENFSSSFLFEHGLFRSAFARRSIKRQDKGLPGLRAGGKPVPTFPDHALSGQPSQHVLQDAAVTEIIELVRGIDPADKRHPFESAVGGNDFRLQALMRLEIAMQATNGDLLVAFQSERLPRRALLEYQRNHAHADQIRAMNAFK